MKYCYAYVTFCLRYYVWGRMFMKKASNDSNNSQHREATSENKHLLQGSNHIKTKLRERQDARHPPIVKFLKRSQPIASISFHWWRCWQSWLSPLGLYRLYIEAARSIGTRKYEAAAQKLLASIQEEQAKEGIPAKLETLSDGDKKNWFSDQKKKMPSL